MQTHLAISKKSEFSKHITVIRKWKRQSCTAVIIKMIQTMTMNAELTTMTNHDLSSILNSVAKAKHVIDSI